VKRSKFFTFLTFFNASVWFFPRCWAIILRIFIWSSSNSFCLTIIQPFQQSWINLSFKEFVIIYSIKWNLPIQSLDLFWFINENLISQKFNDGSHPSSVVRIYFIIIVSTWRFKGILDNNMVASFEKMSAWLFCSLGTCTMLNLLNRSIKFLVAWCDFCDKCFLNW